MQLLDTVLLFFAISLWLIIPANGQKDEPCKRIGEVCNVEIDEVAVCCGDKSVVCINGRYNAEQCLHGHTCFITPEGIGCV